MKILHIITGLEVGGAETMLLRLLSACKSQEFQFEVISLTNLGPIAKSIAELNIPVRSLGLSRERWALNPFRILQLISLLHQLKPDLVQTWMYHANVIGGVAVKLASRRNLIWSIRQTNVDTVSIRLQTSLIAKGAALLSGFIPNYILYNSHTSRQAHAALGYCDRNSGVIGNGFDLNLYKPNYEARSSVRLELGLSNDALLVGLIARYDPQKDHATFINAAKQICRIFPECNFLLVGKNVDGDNYNISNFLKETELLPRFHLLGYRQDTSRLIAALDIACSSSIGEGFPNTIGEAMACGVSCVVTDVGDSALLVGNTGKVVPPARPDLLAEQIQTLLLAGPEFCRSQGLAARERIRQHYSLPAIAAEYEELWRRFGS